MQRVLVSLLLVCFALGLLASRVFADGGTVRLSKRHGDYQITVFTAPTPLRVGPVDISILVQDARTGHPQPDVQAIVKLTAIDRPMMTLHSPATREAATNKLYLAAPFELPHAGEWKAEITLEGPSASAVVGFALEAAEPMPPWVSLVWWTGWPILAILLFGIHQVLVYRRGSAAIR